MIDGTLDVCMKEAKISWKSCTLSYGLTKPRQNNYDYQGKKVKHLTIELYVFVLDDVNLFCDKDYGYL